VVFDIGANIGMYALHLAATVPGVRVHCFEPIPFLFEALQRNLSTHAPVASARNIGLAATAGEATFEVDPNATVAATMHPALFGPGIAPGATRADWIAAGLADLERIEPNKVISALRTGLARPATRALTLAALQRAAAFMEWRKRRLVQSHQCQLDTVSAALAQSGVAHVDLMKIDVEGAEESVIDGIAASDWPRIRQLVIEVHDVDGRRDRLAQRLADAGYRVTHDREPWEMHRLMRISTLYALRH